MPEILGSFLANLGRFWTLTAAVIAWPLACAVVIKLVERRPGYRFWHALYLSVASYLAGLPFPEACQPRTASGIVIMCVNRLAGIAAFAYLICAFVDALDRR